MTLWIRLWTALRSASSTLVLAVVWISVLTPLGLVSRSLRSDPLQRSFDPGLPSYWADRDDPGAEARPDGASEGVVGFLVARGK
ncbi:MAG: hypothetical protein R3F61_20425, partial [Myxococcota bacterium]